MSTDPRIAGLIQVTRDSFFTTIGLHDVHPHLVGRYEQEFGYVSEWRLRSRELVGKSSGTDTFQSHACHVTPKFLEANRSTLTEQHT